MKLCIVGRAGTVHRVFANGATCPTAAAATRQVEVSPLQCAVYKLGPCGSCWPARTEFERLVGGRGVQL